MKSRTFNNSLNNIKDSKCSMKRIRNLSNRIQSLQNDIDKIQNSKKKISNINKIEIEKNNSILLNDSNIKHNENKYSINKTIVKNPYFFRENKKSIRYRTNNNSQRKINSKIDTNLENIIYKKIKAKKYNNLINDKKNIFLNFNSNFKCNEKKKRIIKDILESNYHNNENEELKSQSINFTTLNHFSSNDKINTNLNQNKKEKCEENKKMNDRNFFLDMEYELRVLKNRMKTVLKHRKDLNGKIFLIKNENKKLKNSIISEQSKNKEIFGNLILLNEEYLLNKSQNEFDNFENNMNYGNKNIAIKDILFNIMDIKFEYEKNILYDKFTEGLNELLLNIPILNINNSDNNIANKINRLLHLKNKLNNYEEKYSSKKIDNNKYYLYFTNLLTQLKLKSFEELKEYIKNIFIKNIQENKRMKEITNALINDNDSLSKDIKDQTLKMKYINNAINLNKKEKNLYNKHKNKNKSAKNTKINYGLRNKRRNSFHLHGLCYNPFLNSINKRNIYNTKIDKQYFRSRVNNENEIINFNNINILRDEEEKN